MFRQNLDSKQVRHQNLDNKELSATTTPVAALLMPAANRIIHEAATEVKGRRHTLPVEDPASS